VSVKSSDDVKRISRKFCERHSLDHHIIRGGFDFSVLGVKVTVMQSPSPGEYPSRKMFITSTTLFLRSNV
jgi:hypothetical protein